MTNRNVELWIGDGSGGYTRADLFDFEDINYTTRIKDIRDIAKVLTDYSQTFTLPASRNNSKLFSHFYRPDTIGQYDARFKVDAIIKMNGIDFRKGKLSLQKASMKGGEIYSYSVTFFGETVGLKQLIGDDKLQSLQGTILDKLNTAVEGSFVSIGFSDGHIIDEANDELDRAFSADISSVDMCFPFISNKNYYYYDSGDGLSPQDDGNQSRNIHPSATYNSSLNQYTGVNVFDLKPAIKAHLILRAIEEKYNIEFSTDFFNSTNDVWQDLFVYCNREKGGIDEQIGENKLEVFLNDYTLIGGGGSDGNQPEYRIAPELTDLESSLDTFFVGGSQGFLYTFTDFIINQTITPTITGATGTQVVSSNSVWSLKIINAINNDTLYEQDNILGSHDIQFTIVGNNNEVRPKFILTANGTAEGFQLGTLKITKRQRQNTGIMGSIQVTDSQYNTYFANSSIQQMADATQEGLNITRNLPDMTVMSFLSTLFKMFNLTAYYDDGIIRVRTLDEYYADGKYYEISKYIDSDKINVSKTVLYDKIDFTYDGNKTLAVYKSNQITGDEFGNERVDHNTDEIGSPLAFDGSEKYEVKLPLEKMMFERMTDQDNEDVLTDIQWGWVANSDARPMNAKPMFMYCHKVRSGTELRFSFVDGGTSVLKRNYIVPTNLLDATDEESQSLHFGSEVNEYNGNFSRTSLFDSYYKDYIKRIYDRQSRLFKLQGYLPTSLLYKIEPNDRFVINGVNYRINSFDVSLTTGETKFELMNEVGDAPVVTEADVNENTTGNINDEEAIGEGTSNDTGGVTLPSTGGGGGVTVPTTGNGGSGGSNQIGNKY